MIGLTAEGLPKEILLHIIEGEVKASKRKQEFVPCVDLVDAAVVHFESHTSKSLSFWVGKPWIEQDYRKVGDYWLCSSNRSTAIVKILGETILTIEYRDYVVRPKSGSILMACTSRQCGVHDSTESLAILVI